MYTADVSKMKPVWRVTLTTLCLLGTLMFAACGSLTAPATTSSSVDKPLADPNEPAKLGPGWSWNQGTSQQSAYALDSGVLTITAGSKTQQWDKTNSAPYVTYDAEGDFAAQTKLDFGAGPVSYWAGIGIMSADDPTQWVRLVPNKENGIGLTRNGGPEVTATTAFTLTTVYLKVQRRGGVISAYYSKDGTAWQPVSDKYEYNLSPKVKVYLVALTLSKGLSARFSDVKITPL
jgi:regulation of enolase protein 1 (concanavalin A-like superfamily)